MMRDRARRHFDGNVYLWSWLVFCAVALAIFVAARYLP